MSNKYGGGLVDLDDEGDEYDRYSKWASDDD